jgi:hypothetical protein
MTHEVTINAKSRRGVQRYTENPSIKNAIDSTKSGVRRITNKKGDGCFVVSNNNEILAPAGFYEIVNVDKTQFIKLHVNGVKAFQGLSSAGTKMFEVIYYIMQENPRLDRFYLHFNTVQKYGSSMSLPTFKRGMSELIKKEFIFESIEPNIYFLNINYMFNGDRLAFIKEYRLSDEPLTNVINKVSEA